MVQGLNREGLKKFLAELEKRNAPAVTAKKAQVDARNAVLYPTRYSIVDGVLTEDLEGSLVMYDAHLASAKLQKEESYSNGYGSGHSSATDRSCSWRD